MKTFLLLNMEQEALKSHADGKKQQIVVGKLHSAESITQFFKQCQIKKQRTIRLGI